MIIDEAFEKQLVPLSVQELAHLEASVIADGCREPLIVWPTPDGDVLVDGHNRHRICQQFDIPFETHAKEFDNRDAAAEWIDLNQAGRRNLSPEDFKIVTGRIYNRRKNSHGFNQWTNKSPLYQRTERSSQIGNSSKTHQQLAKELGIGEQTVIRNGQRAELHDKLQDIGDDEAAAKAKTAAQAIVSAVKDLEPEKAAKVVKAHVSHNSGQNEWYTPLPYLEAARAVMGGIDLDPASCETANRNVQATTFYSKELNGLEQPWTGRVWINPPYAQPLIAEFAERLATGIESRAVSQACCLVNNASETKWFRTLARHATARCDIAGRVKFLDTSGEPKGAPLQGQVVLYFGDREDRFVETFSSLGDCWKPARGGNPE